MTNNTTTIYTLLDVETNKELEIFATSGNKATAFMRAVSTSTNPVIRQYVAEGLFPGMRAVEVLKATPAANPQARKIAEQKDAQQLQERVTYWKSLFQI